MRPYLPAYLIHSILLCAASANTEGSSIPLSPSSTVVDTLGSETNTRLASHPTGQITTWDVGFSLRRDWADLGEEEECPVPPKLIIVHPDDSNGDQQVLEAVVSKLHSSIVAGVPEAFEALGKPFEETTTEAPKYVHEEFVSFEEWKRIKLAEEGGDDENLIPTPDLQAPPAAIQQAGTDSQSQDQQRVDPGEVKRTAGDTSSAEDQASKPPPSSPDGAAHSNGSNPSSFVIETPSSIKPPPASPNTLQNRYNYASPDCSARIHSSSPQTQHASSLLHKSRDRYMLTPCKSDQHWVVIELCDEIRIEAVEVAVWEFFSGVVRDIRVSVGGAEDDEEEEEEEDVDVDVTEGTVKGRDNKWKEVGAFVGKNVRGFQVSGLHRIATSSSSLVVRRSLYPPRHPFTASSVLTSPPTTAPNTTARYPKSRSSG